MALPKSITAGDTLSITASGADYPASAGWVGTLRLVPRGSGSVVSITGTASGDDHLFSAAAATTAAYTAGEYSAAVYVTLGAARHTLDSGIITIAPDPGAIVAGTDTRSQAEIALAACKTALAAWTPTKRSYTIGDTSITFNSTADIVALIHFWEGQVAKERQAAAMAAGRFNPSKVYVRAGRA